MTTKTENGNIKRIAGLVAGFAAFAAILLIPIANISPDGHKCLAITTLFVVWLATGAVPPVFTGMFVTFLFVYMLDRETVPMETVFSAWQNDGIYLVIGGYLIAQAFSSSGLGGRLCLMYMSRFAKDFKGLIISCYTLCFLLSVVIPQPSPRCILLASIIENVALKLKLSKAHTTQIRIAIFIGALPTSMILLTGLSSFSIMVTAMAGAPVTYLEWFKYMGVPGIFTTVMTCAAQLIFINRAENIAMPMAEFREKLSALGVLSADERKMVFYIISVVLLWIFGGAFGLDPGWASIFICVCMCFPVIGGLLNSDSWKALDMTTVFFFVSLMTVGNVGMASGMSAWITSVLISVGIPQQAFLFALVITLIAMALHMMLGSAMSSLGIATPALITVGTSLGFHPLVPAFLTFGAITNHWVLPYQNLPILLGVDDKRGYTTGDVVRMAIPQTINVLITSAVMIGWWKLVGLV